MKLLPYSNSFHKIKIKKEINFLQLSKIIIYTFLSLIAMGFIFQIVYGKVVDSIIKERNKYIRIDGKKYSYNVYGEGSYTVIFDGDIGANMSQWYKVISLLEENFDGKILTYNRTGYGSNDYNGQRTVAEQAEDLRMVLKKSGNTGPYILVGEGYGSLVLTNFAKEYPQLVGGMVLINPINEDYLKDEQYLKSLTPHSFMKKIESKGSYIGLTYILNSIGVTHNPKGFVENLREVEKKEFLAYRVRPSYTNAVSMEINNLMLKNSSSQSDNLLGGKPLAIVVNENSNVKAQKELKTLSDTEYFQYYSIKPKGDIASLEESNIIYNAIKDITKQYKQLKKLQQSSK